MKTDAIRTALKSQYYAALTTLQQIVNDCPDTLWTDTSYASPFWRIAYHALFYTDFYLEKHADDLQENKFHRKDYEQLAQVLTNLEGDAAGCSKSETLEYIRYCQEKADRVLETMDLDQPDSGFYWYNMPKLEHQIVNIRHLQHHAAQLSDRLRNAAEKPTRWVQGR
ncbi:MAG: DinB family protein [Saprospiraceae bacterium]|nr:DinB family protein [Lewinella sp.]